MKKQQILHTIKIGHPKKDMKHIKQKQQQQKKNFLEFWIFKLKKIKEKNADSNL